MKIGILAMQGAFLEHQNTLEALGVKAVQVRKPEDLSGLAGLIIPGGESTTIGKMLVRYDMMEPLKQMGRDGFPIFGTCAGMVLLSKEIKEGMNGQPLLGLMDASTVRNAYGRQNESFEADIPIPALGEEPFHGVFIRAPIIGALWGNAKALARFHDQVVAVRQDNLLATSFHPELTADPRLHQYFINMIKETSEKNG